MTRHNAQDSGFTAHLGRVYTPLEHEGWTDIPNGVLVVDQSGRISAVGSTEEELPKWSGVRVVDHGRCLIAPGLVDCHQHLAHYEWTRQTRELFQWLSLVYELERRFEDARHAAEISKRFFGGLVRNGTTTCCVHGPYFAEATDIAFQAARESGLRVIMGMNAGDTDLPEPMRRNAERSLHDAQSLHAKWNGAERGLLSYCFTVRPAYCASDRLLRGTADVARACRAMIQCHLGEDRKGQRQILAKFPDGTSEVAVYEARGLLTPGTVMAHCVHLGDEDYLLLQKRGVSVAHCPRANLLAGGRQLDTQRVCAAGLVMGLGTDLGAGKGLSMFRTMEDALKVSPSASIHDVFRLATLGGAQTLGLDALTGSLEKGKNADFVVFLGNGPATLGTTAAQDIDDVLASLLFCGDDRRVAKCFVAGQRIWPR